MSSRDIATDPFPLWRIEADAWETDFSPSQQRGATHAALSGQFMFEQTFLLPPAGMLDPARSPLRILERLTGRALV